MASNEVAEAIGQILKDFDSTYLYPAMTKACALVANQAKQNAPDRHGYLIRSIDFDVEQNGQRGVIFSNAEYAPYVELGTGIYASQGDGRDTPWRYKDQDGWHTTSGMAAQPFLQPAIQQNTSRIKQCFEGLFK